MVKWQKVEKMQNSYWITLKISIKALSGRLEIHPCVLQDIAALTPSLQLITPSRSSGTVDHVRSLDDLSIIPDFLFNPVGGGFKCECRLGFELHQDGFRCMSIPHVGFKEWLNNNYMFSKLPLEQFGKGALVQVGSNNLQCCTNGHDN